MASLCTISKCIRDIILNRFPDWVKERQEIQGALLWLVVVALFLSVLVWQLDGPDWLRGIGFFFAGLGIAPIALALANRRATIQEKTAETDKQRRIDATFAKSVELLGNDKRVARQGGLYALGNLAKEGKVMHQIAIDVIASFVREGSSSRNSAQNSKEQKKSDEKQKSDSSERGNSDIEAAISVLKDRKVDFDRHPPKKSYVFDLSNTALKNIDATGIVLSNVNLSDCLFESVVFVDAKLGGCSMVGSKFPECDFGQADFNGAAVEKADFSESKNLTPAQVDQMRGDSSTKLPKDFKIPEHWLNKKGG